MVPLWILLAAVIAIVVVRNARVLAESTQKRIARAVLFLAIAVAILVLLRVGMPWLAAGGAAVMVALRWLGPLVMRLLPLLLSRLGQRNQGNAARSDWEQPSGDNANERDRTSSSSRMTRTEALEVLGLAESASDDDVRVAYAAIIKKVHPDLGGTAYLAARVNMARDLLLSRET